MKRNSTTHIVIIAASLFLVSLVGYYFLLVQIKNMNESAHAFIAEANVAAETQAQLRSLRNLEEETRGQQEELDTYFVKRSNIVAFLERIESLQEITGAVVEVSSINEVETDSGGSFLSLSVSATGSFETVFHLLVLLESMPFRIDISRVQFVGRDGVTEDETLVTVWQATIAFSVATI